MKIEIKRTDNERYLGELISGDVFYLFDKPECPMIFIKDNDWQDGEGGHEYSVFDLSSNKEIKLKGGDTEVRMYRNFKFVGEV